MSAEEELTRAVIAKLRKEIKDGLLLQAEICADEREQCVSAVSQAYWDGRCDAFKDAATIIGTSVCPTESPSRPPEVMSGRLGGEGEK